MSIPLTTDILSTLARHDPSLVVFLQEEAPEGVWLLKDQSIQPDWSNLSFWRSLGYDDLPANTEHTWRTVLHPQDVSIWQKQLQEIRLSANSKGSCEIRLRHRQGYWIEGCAHVMRIVAQETYFLVGITHHRVVDRQAPRQDIWEKTLRQSHQIYVLEIDPNGYYTYLNEAFCRNFGVKAKDWIGRYATDNISPAYHEACHAAVTQSVAQPDVPVSVLLGKPGADNVSRLTHWEFTALTDAEGALSGILALGGDLTEHHEALQQNAFQAKLLSSVGQAIIATDPQGIIQYWNLAAEQLYGWKAHEFIGRSVVDVTPSNQSRQQAHEIMQALAAGQAWRGEFEVQGKDGRLFPVEVVNNPIFDEQGQLSGVIGVSSDISERRATQQALANSERKYRLLVDHAPMGIVIHTPDTIEYLNAQAAAVLGDSVDNLLGRSVLAFLSPEHRETSMAELQALFASQEGAVSVSEETIVTTDGQTKHLLISGVKVPFHGHEALCSVFTDITEARKTQADLIRSERKYRFLFDHIKDLICLHDPDGTYREVSPAVKKLLGYPPEALLGTNPYDLFHPEDIPRIQQESHQQILRGSNHTRIQYRIRRQDGQYLWFDTFTEPIIDAETGQVSQLMTTSRDITDMKALAEEKEQLSRLFQAMLSNADDYIFFKDLDHRFIAASQSVLDLFELDSIQQLVGKRDIDFMSPGQAEMFQQMEKQVLEEEKMVQEIQTITNIGTLQHTTYLDNRKSPIYDTAGRIMGLYGIARDITPLKEVEQELTRSTDLLLDAQRLARIGSYYTDLVSETWVGSDNFIAMFGLPAKDRYHVQEFTDLLHPDDQDEVMAHFHQCVARQQNFEYEYRVIQQQIGQVMHVMSRSRITYAEDGTPLTIYGIKQDITEQKEAEEAKRLAEYLTLKNKEMEQFAYVASHDLQEPLRTINSYVTLLQEDYEGQLGEDADIYIRFISSATQRMGQLISGLLDYSRLGKDPLRSEVDCHQLVHQVQEDLAARLKQTGARLQVEPLPTLEAYAVELRQLFQNLITNALKFQAPDNTPEIRIGAQRSSGGWVFFVSDNGIGIAPRYQKKIFQLFQRLHNRSEYEGTGIGLANCKKIVELHHGKIWVESQPGQGSTFFFSINL